MPASTSVPFTHQTVTPDNHSYFTSHHAAATAALGDNPQCISTLTEAHDGGWQITTTWEAAPKPIPSQEPIP